MAILAGVAAAGVRFSGKGWLEPFERDGTECIKGFFIGLVFISHVSGYLFDAGGGILGDRIARWIVGTFGQMIVVMFLVYSGYGVMRSILAKGKPYISAMPVHRIGRTMLRFDVAVMAFLVLSVLLGNVLPLGKVALSLVAWESLGNSNWYIFVIVLCYLIAWAWASAVPERSRLCPWSLALLVFVYVASMVALSFVKERWWYDTMLAFPLGCLLAVHEKKVKAFAREWYWPLIALCAAAFVALNRTPVDALGFVANAKAIAFGMFVVVATMKLGVRSGVLQWMGKRLFPIYVYQRLPMIALAAIGGGAFVREMPFCYVMSSLAITAAIAWGVGGRS